MPFRSLLKSLAGLLVCLSLCATASAAPEGNPAGNVEFSVGNVVAVNRGETRQLKRGDTIYAGDVINTQSGRSQLRFADGGFVSLSAETSFRIDQYNYSGKNDGQERGFFTLVRGALRAITGTIGKANKDAYKVETNVATIGIRGTGYTAQTDGKSLTAAVFDGSIFLSNRSGELQIFKGQSGHVSSPDTRPTLTFDRPHIPPTPRYYTQNEDGSGNDQRYRNSNYIDSLVSGQNGIPSSLIRDIAKYLNVDPGSLAGKPLNELGSRFTDQIDSSGRDVSPGTVVPNVTFAFVQNYANQRNTECNASTLCNTNGGYYSNGPFWGEAHANELNTGWSAKYSNSTNQPTEFIQDGNYYLPYQMDTSVPLPFILNKGSAKLTDEGKDDIISWGKWSEGNNFFTCGGCHIQTTLNGNNAVAYVVGQKTETLPTGKAFFSLLGATSPSSSSQSAIWANPQATSGSMSVNFDTHLLDIHLALQFGVDRKYSIDAMGLSFYNSESTWGGYFTTANNAANDCSGSGCYTSLTGFFAGSSAERFGLGYLFYSEHACQSGDPAHGCSYTTIGGTAAYKMRDTGTGVSGLTGVSLASSDTGGPGGATNINAYFSAANGNKLLMLDVPTTDGVRSITNGTVAIGDIKTSASGTDLSWSRWSNGTLYTTDGLIDVTQANAAAHVILGVPTSNMPTTGSATYNLIGGTAPGASSSDPMFANGSLTTGSLSVNFASNSVSANLGISFTGGPTYAVSGATATINGANFAGSSTGVVSGCAACTVNLAGFFAGNAAAKAGLGYEIIDSKRSDVRIQGVGAFAKP